MKIKYLPEPYDCYEFELVFECAPTGQQTVKFALGPDEMKDLFTEMKRAQIDRMRQKPMSDKILRPQRKNKK